MNPMERACGAEGCDRAVNFGLQNLCHYHDAIRQARELSPSELDDLRAEMVTVVSLTAGERARRKLKSTLMSVDYYGKSATRPTGGGCD